MVDHRFCFLVWLAASREYALVSGLRRTSRQSRNDVTGGEYLRWRDRFGALVLSSSLAVASADRLGRQLYNNYEFLPARILAASVWYAQQKSTSASDDGSNVADHRKGEIIWITLGFLAFGGLLFVYWLMVHKSM